MKRVIGVETEFSIAPESGSPGDDPVGREEILGKIVNLSVAGVPARLPGITDSLGRSGYFLSNGSRLYRDGWHVEYATAETTSPQEAIHQILAGERLISEGIRLLNAGKSKFALYKTNLSYGAMPATFGCHENYSVTTPLSQVRSVLLPFLCSRVIFTGAGGFNPHRPMSFTLSPRVRFLTSADGSDRSIANGRDEPLGEGIHRRLHLTCGESLCSHLSMYLKLGTTALVVAMAEAGQHPAAKLCPIDPLEAIRSFSDDPSCKSVVPVNGPAGCASAIDIQRAYLRMAQSRLGASWMPSWAPRVVERWEMILDLLENGAPHSVARQLDWAIKYKLFVRHACDHGFSPEEVDAWDHDLDRIPIGRHEGHFHLLPQDASRVLRHALTRHRVIDPFPLFVDSDPKWDRLAEVLNLRLQLFEIDTRFSDVSDAGLFNQLDAAGVLEHRLPEVEAKDIEQAMREPPGDTRALLRSRAIRRLAKHGRGKRFLADWHKIVRSDRRLHLSPPDPLECRPCWKRAAKPQPPKLSGAPPMPPLPRVPSNEVTINAVVTAYQRGRFVRARTFAQQVLVESRRGPADTTPGVVFFRATRYLAWTTARLGMGDPTSLLDAIHRTNQDSTEAVGDYLFIYRMMGFAPHEKIVPWVQQATAFLLGNRMSPEIAEPLGAYYLARGDLTRAKFYLAPLLGLGEALRGTRARAALLDVYRRMGEISLARYVLQRIKAHPASRLIGIAAHDVLPAEAKLEENSELRRDQLRLAFAIHKRMNCLSGMIRIALMQARCCTADEARHLREFITRQSPALPVINQCPKFQSILARWDHWTSRAEPDDSGDYWWSL